MAKFITLKLITEEVEPNRPFPEGTEESEIGGEDDGIAQPTAALPTEQRIDWKPNTINVETIRNFYARKGNRPGSRVIMKTGVAYVVLDTHDEIVEKIRAA